ncbi:hypothetical protein [Streptomyces sp. NPDC088923]|uniref:hypothetical protein n=1 Tax=Streptomyces sp. NPDC088923 TaxID=3365913 RepID=UPI00380C0190
MATGAPKASGAVPWDELKKEFGFTEEEAVSVRRRTGALLARVDALRRTGREAGAGEAGPVSG